MRPTPDHVLGFLFPVDSGIPKVVWVKAAFEKRLCLRYPDFTELLQSDNFEGKCFERNELKNFDIDHTLTLHYRSVFLLDGSKSNICVIKTTKGAPLFTSWRGPLVFLSQCENSEDSEIMEYIDIRAADLRVAVDSFIDPRSDNQRWADAKMMGKTIDPYFRNKLNLTWIDTVEGVKIKCKGDLKTYGGDVYVSVNVPVDHAIFKSAFSPNIPKLLGVEILVKKLPFDPDWIDGPNNGIENIPVAVLHMNADTKDDYWGTVPTHLQFDIGNVIIVRADRKPLTPKQVEALCRYCQDKLENVMSDCIPEQGCDLEEKIEIREQILNQYLTKDAFRKFFEEFKVLRATGVILCGDEDWHWSKKETEEEKDEEESNQRRDPDDSWLEEVFPGDI